MARAGKQGAQVAAPGRVFWAFLVIVGGVVLPAKGGRFWRAVGAVVANAERQSAQLVAGLCVFLGVTVATAWAP
jgi:hypothetical protein